MEQAPSPGSRLAVAVALSLSIAVAGRRKKALSRSGALGAVLVGCAVQYAGSWRWSAVLLSFFGSSSALSRLPRRAGTRGYDDAIEVRGSERDIVQALANGGVATVMAAASIVQPRHSLAAAFAGSLAAANADTWATEIGRTSTTPPRMLLTGRVVPPGTSGAVSRRGLTASVIGSSLIACVSAAVIAPAARRKSWLLVIAMAGTVGALADSLAGATIQAVYHCPACDKSTERRIHGCSSATVLRSGYGWCTNDMVNVLCTAVGASAAGIAGARLQRDDGAPAI